MGFLKLQLALLMRLVEVRIGQTLEIAADHRLGLVGLGDGDRLHPFAPLAHPGETADEVDEVGALGEELGQPGVVVPRGRDVAVGAGLGLPGAHGVRHVGVEGLAAEARSGDGRLLDVEPLAAGVGRGEDEGRGGADGGDAVPFDLAVDAQHVGVGADDLRVVGGVVAGLAAFEVVDLGLRVRLLGEVATGAGRGPGGVAGVAGHARVGMGEGCGVRRVRRHGAPGRAVLPQGLGEARLLAIVGIARGDGVQDLHHLPLDLGIEHGALPEPAVAPDEPPPAARGGAERQVGPPRGRRRPRGAQGGLAPNGAVAVLAADLQGVAVLAVDQPVAVGVLGEVAIRAVHPLLQMDVLQVDRLLEPVGIVEGDDAVLGIQEIPLAVLLVDGAEDPAVAVVVGELGVLESRVELRDLGQEFRLGPQAAHGRALGIAVEARPLLGRRGVALLLGP